MSLHVCSQSMEKRGPGEDLCGDVSFSLGKWKQTQPREGKFVGPERKGGGEFERWRKKIILKLHCFFTQTISFQLSLYVSFCARLSLISAAQRQLTKSVKQLIW